MAEREQLRNAMGVQEGLGWDKAESGSLVAEPHTHRPTEELEPYLAKKMPLPKDSEGKIDYTSDAALKAARYDNTKKNMDSNFWFEMTGILRWVTTFSLAGVAISVAKGLGIGTVAAEGGFAIGAVGAAGATGVGLPLLIAAGVATVGIIGLVLASQHSRKLAVEKMFDNHEFNMHRQAELIGKSVAREQENPERASDKRWVDIAGASRSARENWQNSVQSPRSEAIGPAV